MGIEKRIGLSVNTKGFSDTQQKLLPLLLSETGINEELDLLDEAEQTELAKMLNEAIEEVNREHTRLMALMGQAIRMPSKQLIWENNHLKITKAITGALARTGRMPNQAYIATATGLNRKTVQEHIVKGDDNSIYIEHLRQYTMMAPRVMDIVLNEAVGERSMKAAKMYFDILDKMRSPNAPNIFHTQNNYIQINNTVIKQETISHLSPEQLKQIEEMVQKSLPAAGDKIEKGEETEVVEV